MYKRVWVLFLVSSSMVLAMKQDSPNPRLYDESQDFSAACPKGVHYRLVNAPQDEQALKRRLSEEALVVFLDCSEPAESDDFLIRLTLSAQEGTDNERVATHEPVDSVARSESHGDKGDGRMSSAIEDTDSTDSRTRKRSDLNIVLTFPERRMRRAK